MYQQMRVILITSYSSKIINTQRASIACSGTLGLWQVKYQRDGYKRPAKNRAAGF